MHSSHILATAAVLFASSAVAMPAGGGGRKSSSSPPGGAVTPAPSFYYTTSAKALVTNYVTLTKCSKPQQPGPDAFKGTECVPTPLAYNTNIPQDGREAALVENVPFLLRCFPVQGYNSAFSFGNGVTMNCVLANNQACQNYEGGNSAVSFQGDLFDTSSVPLGPGVAKVNAQIGNWMMCAIPGQPMAKMADPVNDGGLVMPGEWVADTEYYNFRRPTPIPATLGNQIPLPTPPPKK